MARECLVRTPHSRNYCWGTRYRWSPGAYPKSLRSLDSRVRSPGGSDSVRISYAKSKEGSYSYGYSHAPLGSPLGSWRASSSWGRWIWDRDQPIRKMQAEFNENNTDAAAWRRTFRKFDKDTAELYELIKKRIDADPFDALFGRSLLYPDRARVTCWGLGGGKDPGSKREQPARSTSSKTTKAAGATIVNKQPVDQSFGSFGRTQCTPASSDGTGSNSLADEYDIDLINMRKIPKGSLGSTSKPSTTNSALDQTYEIPVKRFEKIVSEKSYLRPSEVEKTPNSKLTASQVSQEGSGTSHYGNNSDWLLQEGFGSKTESDRVAKPSISGTATKASPTRIESALERRMRTKNPEASTNGARSSLKYEPTEIQTDDVDLLRASDIRAASGAATRLRKHADLQKQEKRMKLEADFAALQKMEAIGLEWKNELMAAKKRLQEAGDKKRSKASDAHLEREILAQKAAMEALETRRAGDGGSRSIITAHAERGEGDMASNVHEFVDRDRWYKRKAPHATATVDQKSLQLAKARSLVRELRGIYEDTYGVIDTKHRQPDTTASGLEEQKLSAPSGGNERCLIRDSEEIKKATGSNGPLSTQEKIGTMLQQLLDDSRYLQKLLRTPEQTPQIREELFHRNRSMQNASGAIAEALSSTSPTSRPGSMGKASASKSRDTITESQERSFSDGKRPSTVYNVLAYDPSTQQVTNAEMSSSGDSSSERKLSLSEALSSLTDPVKFLPQLTRLQGQGYEIISSDTNILVLKKVYKPQPSVADGQAATSRMERQRIINPIDGTTTQSGNAVSPQDVDHQDPEQQGRKVEEEGAEPNPSGYRVRREEDVFSGSRGHRWDERRAADGAKLKSRYRRTSRRRKTTKRMLWVGLWTAGCCYAVGAITELLRA